MKNIVLYGADWCSDCVRAKAFLGKHKIAYEFIDVDQNADAAGKVEAINEGKRIIPTLIIDGTAYTNPYNTQLASILDLDDKEFNEGEDHCGIDSKANPCGDACEF